MASIYSWNVNGIRAAERKGFLDWLQKTSPDVLCLQETKAWKEQLSQEILEPKGYHTYWSEAAKKGYSSTAIYSKVKPLNVIHGFPKEILDKHELTDSYGDTSDEGRITTAEFKEFFVVGVYTPNTKGDLSRIPVRQRWDAAFYDFMKHLEATKPVIFCGDLNVAHTEDDLARPKPNVGKNGFTKEERGGLQKYIDNGFVDTFRLFTQGNGHYSWWSHWGKARENNVGWRIDYVMVSESLKSAVTEANIFAATMGSDHCPVNIIIDKEV